MGTYDTILPIAECAIPTSKISNKKSGSLSLRLPRNNLSDGVDDVPNSDARHFSTQYLVQSSSGSNLVFLVTIGILVAPKGYDLQETAPEGLVHMTAHPKKHTVWSIKCIKNRKCFPETENGYLSIIPMFPCGCDKTPSQRIS